MDRHVGLMRGSAYYREIELLCGAMGGVDGGYGRSEKYGENGGSMDAVFVPKKKKIIKIQSSLD